MRSGARRHRQLPDRRPGGRLPALPGPRSLPGRCRRRGRGQRLGDGSAERIGRGHPTPKAGTLGCSSSPLDRTAGSRPATTRRSARPGVEPTHRIRPAAQPRHGRPPGRGAGAGRVHGAAPDVGIAGSRLERARRHAAAVGVPFPHGRWANSRGAAARPGLAAAASAAWVAPPVPRPSRPTDWVAGASMIVRRAVFEAVGLMDEGYFMYFEEVDFCLRARRAGWPCWYVPASPRGAPGRPELRRDRPQRSEAAPAELLVRARRRYFLSNHGRVATVAGGPRLVSAAMPRTGCGGSCSASPTPTPNGCSGTSSGSISSWHNDDSDHGVATDSTRSSRGQAVDRSRLNRGDRNLNPAGIGFLRPAARGPAHPRRQPLRTRVLGGRRPPLRQLADGLRRSRSARR